MSIYDRTGQAGRMSSSQDWRTSNSYIEPESKKSIDDLLDYKIRANKKANQQIEKDNKKSLKRKVDLERDALKSLKIEASDLSKTFDKMFGTKGLFSSISEYRKTIKEIKTGKGDSEALSKSLRKSSKNIAQSVGAVVEATLRKITQYYTEYARTYESYLKSTGSSLQINRGQYSSLVRGSQQYLNQSGYNKAISSKDTMVSMNQLVQMGITSNLEELSAMQSMVDKISTTFDPSTLTGLIRQFGTTSDVYKLGIASESAIKRALNDHFGDSQYIQSGMYKTTLASLETLIAIQSDEKKAFATSTNIMKNVGVLVESGISVKSKNKVEEWYNKVANGEMVTDAGFWMLARNAGVSMSELYNSDTVLDALDKITSSNNQLDYFNKFNTKNLLKAGSIGSILGYGTTQEFSNNNFLNKLGNAAGDQNIGREVTTKDLYDEFKRSTDNAKELLTTTEKIKNFLYNATGTLGGSSVAKLGSSGVSLVGGALAAVGGMFATKAASKFLSSKLGGSGLTSLLGSSGGTGLGAAIGSGKGLASKFLTSGGVGAIKGIGFTGATKALGGIGGAVGVGVDAYKGATGKTSYKGNKAAQGAQAAFLGTSVLGNTAKYASIGSMFGPWGTLIGAGLGLITGGIGYGIRKKNEKEAAQSTKQEQQSQGTVTSDTTSDVYSDILNSINQSINLQTDKIIAAMTNMYKLIDGKYSQNTEFISSGMYIK